MDPGPGNSNLSIDEEDEDGAVDACGDAWGLLS